MKVKLKREIVTMGQPDVDPRAQVGHYVAPADWNALISAPDVAVIDTRNDYEVAIGTFDGAVDPGTKSFSEFPAWWAANKGRFHNKRIAMISTGGIVYHLKGGILKYLEDVPEEQSLWQGECFVFDDRVSLGHGLRPGQMSTCGACRRPLTPEDRTRPEFEEGVCCHLCAAEYDAADRARFRERQKQMMLSAARGERHMGAD